MKQVRKIVAMFIMLICAISMLAVPDLGTAKAAEAITLSGKAHVQTFADQTAKVTSQNGIQTLVLGTRGMSKRVESVTINLKNNTGYQGTLQYRVHRQTYGWTSWVNAGSPAGTTGQGKRLEAIEMRLTGELAKHYDVRYRAHIQTYGDNQGWVYNGALAGTTGEAKRLEEIQVQIVPRKAVSTTPGASYRVHRQTYGWENVWKKNGETSGTTGQGKRLEGISITVSDNQYGGGITYKTHVQSYGWLDWVSNGEMSGTQGEAKRLEAICIKLTGQLAQYYDVYYRVHVQSYGWLAWVKNGEISGTQGEGKRLEAIQIKLVKKGDSIVEQWVRDAYASVVNDYRTVVRTGQVDESKYSSYDDKYYAEIACMGEMAMAIRSSYCKSRYGYCYQDITGDGIEELIICESYDNGKPGVLAVYTLKDKQCVNVLAGWSRSRYDIFKNGIIYHIGSGGAASTHFSINKIRNAALQCQYNVFFEDGVYYYDKYGKYESAYEMMEKGKKGVDIISRTQYEQLIDNSVNGSDIIELYDITYFN